MEDKFILGAIESPVDLRDYDYSMLAGATDVEIPESFELDYDIPVQNQGKVNSCVAFSLSEMKSYIDNSNYSSGFIYANRSDDDHQGTGLIPREALKHLVKEGDCLKASFDYNIEYPAIKEKISEIGIDKLYAEASQFKSLAYIRLSADEIKEYLVKYKKPIMIVVKVYQNFYTAKTNKGIIPSEPIGTYKGNHAMVIVGYDKNTLKIVNSWGNTGDNGYYYLDINSSIIRELWALEDERNVNRPKKKKYTIGWNKDDKGWWYSQDGLTYVKGDWKQINGNWFRFDSNGYAYQNCWFKYDKDNKWYYFDDNCYMVANKWIQSDGKWYRLGPDGAMLIGWFKDTDGNWYYLDIAKGYMYSNCRILIDGEYYSFDVYGAWIKGGAAGLSTKGAKFIESWEGFSSTWEDVGDGYLTIGIGTATSGALGRKLYNQGIRTCTHEQAYKWLQEECKSCYNAIKNKLDANGITLSQNKIDALISMAYNIGEAGLLGSTLFKNICNAETNTKILKYNFQAWSKCNGKTWEGLLRRRNSEFNLFVYGDYTGNK